MSPQEILYKNKDIISHIIDHHYLPQKDSAVFHEIVGALKLIDPKAKYDTSCSGCMMEIARMANVHLQDYLKTKPEAKFHTFPEHKKK